MWVAAIEIGKMSLVLSLACILVLLIVSYLDQ
jgi:hypothetical protein